MKAIALILLAALAGAADARSLGGGYLFSTDTDNNDIHRYTVNGWEALSDQFDLGASVSRTDFKRSQRHATRGAMQYDLRHGEFASRGDIGVERLASRDFLTGDIVLETYRGNWTLAAGLERALVDSERGIELGLSATTAHVMADWSGTARGAAFILSRTDYSDDNKRHRLRTRLWQSICDCGLFVQAAAETYSNSRPYTGSYFSPDRYMRALAGVGMRRRTAVGTFSGRAEYGVQRVDGDQQASHALSASFESARDPGGWQWRAEFIHDRKQPGYDYNQAQLSLIKRF